MVANALASVAREYLMVAFALAMVANVLASVARNK
jgi:hypothetical protein